MLILILSEGARFNFRILTVSYYNSNAKYSLTTVTHTSDIMVEMTKLSIGNKADELLNVHRAASFLTVSVTTIRRWAQAGKIAGTKVGIRGDWRFTKKDLLKMMKKNIEL